MTRACPPPSRSPGPALPIETLPSPGPEIDYDMRPLFAGDGLAFCALRGTPDPGPGGFERFGILRPESLGRAVPKRQVEFLLGRLCARAAVRRLQPGWSGDIPIGSGRAPQFPLGLSGSITHTDGFVAAVCQDERNGTVGIDAEGLLDADQSARVGATFATEAEIALPGWGKTPPELRYTLVFSAKEAVFKALYPWLSCNLPFSAARIARVNLDHHCLSLALAPRGLPRLPGTLDVRFRVEAERVVTFAVVRPRL